MEASVIGAGNMGRALAHQLVKGGNNVYLANRDEEKAMNIAKELIGVGPGSVQVVSIEDAARSSDIVILAVSFEGATRLAVQLGDILLDKVVVDISNPLNETYDDLITGADTSAAEEIARRIGPRANVVKAFNTVFAQVLFDGGIDGVAADIFIASDNEIAKNKVSTLIQACGLRALDVGPLKRARLLENLALLHIGMQGRYDFNFASSIKVIKNVRTVISADIS
jgi:NADPH-dependent F420 reductase